MEEVFVPTTGPNRRCGGLVLGETPQRPSRALAAGIRSRRARPANQRGRTSTGSPRNPAVQAGFSASQASSQVRGRRDAARAADKARSVSTLTSPPPPTVTPASRVTTCRGNEGRRPHAPPHIPSRPGKTHICTRCSCDRPRPTVPCFNHGLETALHRTPRRRTSGHGGRTRAHERPALPRPRQDAAQGAHRLVDPVAARPPGRCPSQVVHALSNRFFEDTGHLLQPNATAHKARSLLERTLATCRQARQK